MTKYLVWVEGLRGPVAQIWSSIPVDGNGKPSTNVLKSVPIAYDDLRSLDVLMKDYPYEQPSG